MIPDPKELRKRSLIIANQHYQLEPKEGNEQGKKNVLYLAEKPKQTRFSHQFTAIQKGEYGYMASILDLHNVNKQPE